MVWLGWNRSTLKSWVGGHMLSLLIHQFTFTPITGDLGELYTKGQGGRRWNEVGRGAVMWPRHADLTDLQVLKWIRCDFGATFRREQSMLDFLTSSSEHMKAGLVNARTQCHINTGFCDFSEFWSTGGEIQHNGRVKMRLTSVSDDFFQLPLTLLTEENVK